MPELPEVETVSRTLRQLVIGKTISSVDVYWANIIKKPDDVEQFKQELIGQTIHEINRRGKFLVFVLDDLTLVSHLRMEGRYGLFQKDETLTPHTHVVFTFSDGTELRYQDVRKFGTMHIFKKGTEEDYLPLSQLGVEPFSETFTVDLMKKAFQNTTRTIKVVLLDQKTVVGLGNIYVDEALFKARIHPERIASSLTLEELTKLHEAIITTLKEAVELGGSSIKSYVNGQGEMGMFQQQLTVYGRKGEPCVTCGLEIDKTVVGGRGTHFCRNCQN
ncbi:formamidopyrimidine-DNA glycosylase [Halalkalibacter wakoensis JCM 9140]|uniref:Formamidopyrimidine-DNA glycosylase n=1 Tax=Halalkalibacter wakoensis JCM 9140 TaxID=1236970 RepID=W4Q793_9BACI|nr:DNA-formamidopyrimidine glycosylase [Halalkalibacter wakoensis]GAE27911.1 formamidopyrimidine-DNA glycosylase [Halalkalibacter wakoensis JCM 9140]